MDVDLSLCPFSRTLLFGIVTSKKRSKIKIVDGVSLFYALCLSIPLKTFLFKTASLVDLKEELFAIPLSLSLVNRVNGEK